MNRMLRLMVAVSIFFYGSLSVWAQAWKFDRFVNTPYPTPNSLSSGDLEVADFNGDNLVDAIIVGTFKAKAAVLVYFQDKTGFVPVPDSGLPAAQPTSTAGDKAFSSHPTSTMTDYRI